MILDEDLLGFEIGGEREREGVSSNRHVLSAQKYKLATGEEYL